MSVCSKCLGPATCLIAANMDVIVASGIPPNKNHTSVIISPRFHLLDFPLALTNRALRDIWLKGFKVLRFNRVSEKQAPSRQLWADGVWAFITKIENIYTLWSNQLITKTSL